MPSKIKTAPRLPLELVRRVADLCDVPSAKLSLVLLSRACYHDIIGILYKTIHISTLEQLVSLGHALASRQPSLRLFPQSLHIHIRYSGWNYYTETSETLIHIKIRDVLLVVDSLIELVLDISSAATLELFNYCPPESVKFRLKRFSTVLNNQYTSELLKFLSCQSKLEELTCTDRDIWDAELHCKVTSPDSSMLPELKRLTAGSSIMLHLVPGRPVSHIHIHDWIETHLACIIVSNILQATVPLVYLNVAIPGLTQIGKGILAWLSELSHFHESLEALTFRVNQSSKIVRGDLDEFKSTLSRFVAIRTFVVKSIEPYPGYTNTKALNPEVPNFEPFSWWAEVCPSLRFVSLFERDLSAT